MKKKLRGDLSIEKELEEIADKEIQQIKLKVDQMSSRKQSAGR